MNADTDANDTMDIEPTKRDNTDIDSLVRVKTILQNRYAASDPESECAVEYANIQKLVDEYIMKHCEHNIVYDYIDITPDTSKQIRYCTHCYVDFPHP